MGAALTVVVDPRDRTHLLLGTDSGLLGSRNGGRDWEQLAPDVLTGAVLAASVDADGTTFLAANPSTIASSRDGLNWRAQPMPVDVAPPRAIVADTPPGAFYLLGWRGIFHTDDGGTSWSPISTGLPEPVTQVLVTAGAEPGLLAIADATVWRSRDGGRTWRTAAEQPLGSPLETLAIDRDAPNHVWGGGANRVFESEDAGHTWAAMGSPLREAGLRIHGIVAGPGGDATRVILSTDRGLYLTRDAGATWHVMTDNLPGHIEAGPLVQDPRQPSTLYAGFSITPYQELWQGAAVGGSVLARLGPSEAAGAVAFIILLGLGATWALRSLDRRARLVAA